MLRRLVGTVLLLVVATLPFGEGRPAYAEDGAPLDKAVVGGLLMDAGNDEDPDAREAAWKRLRAIGWAKLEPHVDLRIQRHWQQRSSLYDVVLDMAEGEGIFRLALHMMRVGDEEGNDDVAMQGIGLLESALDDDGLEGEADVAIRESRPGAKTRRLAWNAAWWPDLLREMHRTEPVEIEGFYSGPGFPSWNLDDLLGAHVHGQESALIQATMHREWRIRMMALPFLAATTTGRTDAVRAALRSAVKDEIPRVRRMAIHAISSGRWRALAPDVAARLADDGERDAVRADAAEHLAYMVGEGDLDGITADEIEALFVRTIEDGPEPVAARAASVADEVSRSRRLLAVLVDALQEGKPALRVGAAEGLRMRRDERTLPEDLPVDTAVLLRRVDDPSTTVRYVALRILAERGAVPATLAPRLVGRLRGEDRWDVLGAVSGLASLRAAATPHLAAMRDALRGAPGAWAHDLRQAIASIRLAGVSVKAIDNDLASELADRRLAAVDELARRDDRARLVKALASDDPDVAVRAAVALAPHEEHATAVLDTVLRVHGRAKGYLTYRVLHILGPRLEAHADRVLAPFRRTRGERWFDLAVVSETLRPALAALAWKDFLRTPEAREAGRVATLHAQLLPRVLEALVGEDAALRRGAGLVVQRLSQYLEDDGWGDVEAALARLPADDPTRIAAETEMRERGCGRFRPPRGVWVELR